MNNPNKIENLSELLRITWIEDMLQAKGDEAVFSQTVPADMPNFKKSEMIDKLYAFTLQPSFGELLTKNLEVQNETDVLKKTELSEAMLQELKEDKLAVNNVPVLLLKNLLSELRISFASAQAAILKTFELLHTSVIPVSDHAGVRPIFRKGSEESSEGFKRVPNKDLFENETSLNKYLNRLEKLMQ